MSLSAFWTWRVAIGRKNYVFAKTEAGAEANTIWYTFIQTAKLNQLKVREYSERFSYQPSHGRKSQSGKLIYRGLQKFNDSLEFNRRK